jgi:hypothetical protein
VTTPEPDWSKCSYPACVRQAVVKLTGVRRGRPRKVGYCLRHAPPGDPAELLPLAADAIDAMEAKLEQLREEIRAVRRAAVEGSIDRF